MSTIIFLLTLAIILRHLMEYFDSSQSGKCDKMFYVARF